MYPPIEPYERGMLPVGDGHLIYYELCGNPKGQPAVVLHGGPGSGCTDFFRRLFDPLRYRVVLFDKRNCGRSKPHASDIDVSLQTNTTHHLIEDVERIRHHLAINKWLLYGGSWGTTLGLAYARIVTHFFAHNAWLEDGILLRNAGKLAGIPGILVHGRLDLAAPLTTAWELRQAWPGSKLIIVDQEGHDSSGPGMVNAIVAATDQLA